MKLLTWNIQWGLGMDGRVDLARIVRHARTFDPDVICFQEVADNMPDLSGNDGADQFADIAAHLPGYRPIAGAGVQIFDDAGRQQRFGNMVLSRLPVRQVLRHQLPWPGMKGLNMPRMLIEASIVSPFGPLRIMTTHLEYFSASLRASAVEAIRSAHADAISREETSRDAGAGPYALVDGSRSAILCGDFNMPPQDPIRLRLLDDMIADTCFVDAWTTRHGDIPHPPSFCIVDHQYGEPHCADYILITPDLAHRVVDIVYDVETRLSDHQPVCITLNDA